jgi:small subunit ribosomal protein S1
MVHKTDLSWTVKVNNPGDLYAKGDEVEAIILSINHDEKKVSLGIKQLYDDPWGDILDKYKPGTVIEEATVLKSADYGTFVKIVDGIEGLIPTSEIPEGVKLRARDKVRAEVANLDAVDLRVTLTMRSPGESPKAETLDVMRREQAGKGATLGDVLKDKLQNLATAAEESATKGDAEAAAAEPEAPSSAESEPPEEDEDSDS